MTRDPLIVPPAFARHWVSEGEHEWVAGLPAQAAAAMRRWDLTADGEPLHGWCAVVLPVRAADGTPAMLKITRPHPEAEHEALALSTWDGDGAVRLLAAEPWELLLERLDPAHSLDDEPLPVALGVITSLLRRLDRPAPPRLRALRDVAARWVRELPEGDAPAELVEQAVAYCAELGPRAGDRLVNEDLHFENVLRGEREPWLVIDPKPLAGDPEFGLIALLWNRWEESSVPDRLAAVVDAAGLDHDLARRWAFVRAVENWSDPDSEDPATLTAPAIARALA
ncbi:aminoglycoside phosphotransferase family protein [Actinokineospora spheciospongiae]|uniref:aminoglycoside phosphotransferase family protein n=1 Tax=Actinokineospora spheciospongiae TaxID=909613 RepID=UPI000556EB15|nr:aminoglycoside phosphotransferase family protein [Actinokineospora spheciospongiae]